MLSKSKHFKMDSFIITIIVGICIYIFVRQTFNRRSIKYVLFDPRAIIPRRATDGSVGYDIFAYEDVSILPEQTTRIPTGFGLQISPGYYAEIHARSSHSIKHTTVGAGIIDEDYTKEISVIYTNISEKIIHIKAGTAIAQFKIHETIKIEDRKSVV